MIKRLTILFLIVFPTYLLGQSDQELNKMWKKAIIDAANFKLLKQPNPLFAIRPQNLRIEISCRKEWKCQGGEKDWFENGKFKEHVRVKVLTWIDKNATFFDEYVGNKKTYSTGNKYIWATAVPEIKLICTGIGDLKKTKLRLEQYMGLPYNGNKGKFVSMWVEPRNLFRPCPDAEIFDAKCETRFPANVSALHKTWQNTQAEKSFPAERGYPWTRRGFSYDWGGTNNHQGASEYVISVGSQVYIDSIDTTEKYCGLTSSPP